MTRDKQEEEKGPLKEQFSWSERLQNVVAKMGAKTAAYPTEEIEADISEAVEEVRKAKRA